MSKEKMLTEESGTKVQQDLVAWLDQALGRESTVDEANEYWIALTTSIKAGVQGFGTDSDWPATVVAEPTETASGEAETFSVQLNTLEFEPEN